MGDGKECHLRVNFDRQRETEIRGNKVTSDAGRQAYHELGEALALTAMNEDVLTDPGPGRNKQDLLVPTEIFSPECVRM